MIKLLKSFISDTNPLRLAYHWLRSYLEAWKAGFPARKLTVICITGTDGKTTTVSMLAHILHASGKCAGAASTAFLEIDGVRESNPTQKTSLTARSLQRFLNRLVSSGCKVAIIEVSSHGLMQSRLSGIVPQVAAITNISMEHLDYHGSMKEYIRAKSLLFCALKGQGTKVLNRDDETYEAFIDIPSKQTIEYSPQNQLINIESSPTATKADATIDGTVHRLALAIPGSFNLSNALCAISCAQAVGIDPKQSIDALATYAGAPGRMDRIDEGQTFSVFVDFTVTPVAYERTLTSLRSMLAPGKRLLVLTGSCGDRMPEKRPMVGKICSELADVVVVSNEDPYSEDPEAIIDDVLAGVQKEVTYQSENDYATAKNHPSSYCVRISDRMKAILFLLHEARDGDIVLFCGKGADITMMTAAGQVPWDERSIVRDALRARKN